MNNFNVAQTAEQISDDKVRPKRRRFYEIYRKNVKNRQASRIAKIDEKAERLPLYRKS